MGNLDAALKAIQSMLPYTDGPHDARSVLESAFRAYHGGPEDIPPEVGDYVYYAHSVDGKKYDGLGVVIELQPKGEPVVISSGGSHEYLELKDVIVITRGRNALSYVEAIQ